MGSHIGNTLRRNFYFCSSRLSALWLETLGYRTERKIEKLIKLNPSKIYDRQDEFEFDNVNFPVFFFLDRDVPLSKSYCINISQLIQFARASSHVTIFNAHNKTAELHKQSYRYHKLFFLTFYRRHYKLVSKFKVGLKSILQQDLSEPELYGDLVSKLKKCKMD